MTIPFAVNGLGRIGRALLRIARERSDLRLVAVNDLGSAEQLAGLVAHDSLHGRFAGTVRAVAGELEIDGKRIAVFNQPDPSRIPWEQTEARIVVDATGHCKRRAAAGGHRRGGIEKVLVSANAPELDLTLCLGVNDRAYDPALHHLISAASCTTNCLAPVVHVLHGSFGFVRGTLSTVHSYNNDQSLLETPHQDPRRARAAALNMIPTTTSAVAALDSILPELAGRLTGFAVRVPTPNVSLLDLVAEISKPAGAEEVNDAFRQAASAELQGVLATTHEELVSSDFLRRPESAVIDLPLTRSLDGHLVRVVAWYDNEWGHASRLADLLQLLGSALAPREENA